MDRLPLRGLMDHTRTSRIVRSVYPITRFGTLRI
jgi:hypothetical protein